MAGPAFCHVRCSAGRAVVTAIRTAIGVYHNAAETRALETEREDAALVLEAIKTGLDNTGADKVKRNLAFMVKVGLIHDQERAKHMSAALNDPDERGPSLAAPVAAAPASSAPVPSRASAVDDVVSELQERCLVRDFRRHRLDGVKRGDLVTVALHDDQGKPRPALIVQADRFSTLDSVTVLPITDTLRASPLLRMAMDPDRSNGLDRRSHIMLDKPQTPARTKVGAVIGHLDGRTMAAVDRGLLLFLGLG